MIIESLLFGVGAVLVAAGHRVIQEQQRQRTQHELAEMQFRAILASQEVQAKTSAARKAMVDEVRRYGGVGHTDPSGRHPEPVVKVGSL